MRSVEELSADLKEERRKRVELEGKLREGEGRVHSESEVGGFL